jgi:hypothetical protein
MCSFNLDENAYLEQTETICTLKTVVFRKYCFQTLSQLLQENKVLDAPGSNTKGFLSRNLFLQLS